MLCHQRYWFEYIFEQKYLPLLFLFESLIKTHPHTPNDIMAAFISKSTISFLCIKFWHAIPDNRKQSLVEGWSTEKIMTWSTSSSIILSDCAWSWGKLPSLIFSLFCCDGRLIGGSEHKHIPCFDIYGLLCTGAFPPTFILSPLIMTMKISPAEPAWNVSWNLRSPNQIIKSWLRFRKH